jgi:uncharacterized protein YxjI
MSKTKATRYLMKQRLISIGDDFYIKNKFGEQVYKVDGKALRVRDTLIFEDLKGNELCHIQEKLLYFKDTVKIERNGMGSALVKKALFTPFRDRFVVHLENGDKLKVKGDILNHEYKIRSSKGKLAQVSKRWFRIRDTYGVQVEADADDVLMLAITVVIDVMAQKEEDERKRKAKRKEKREESKAGD